MASLTPEQAKVLREAIQQRDDEIEKFRAELQALRDEAKRREDALQEEARKREEDLKQAARKLEDDLKEAARKREEDLKEQAAKREADLQAERARREAELQTEADKRVAAEAAAAETCVNNARADADQRVADAKKAADQKVGEVVDATEKRITLIQSKADRDVAEMAKHLLAKQQEEKSQTATKPEVVAEATTSTSNANNVVTFGLRTPYFKSGEDIESFLGRFEVHCSLQNVKGNRRAELLLGNAIDSTTFRIVDRELTTTEKTDYDTIKKHLLKRFGIDGQEGLQRLALTHAQRQPGQDLQSFYTELLGLAAKAHPGPHTAEQAKIVDRLVCDSFVWGCGDEKIRLHLLLKKPQSTREALEMALSHMAVLTYNESIKGMAPAPETLLMTHTARTTGRGRGGRREDEYYQQQPGFQPHHYPRPEYQHNYHEPGYQYDYDPPNYRPHDHQWSQQRYPQHGTSYRQQEREYRGNRGYGRGNRGRGWNNSGSRNNYNAHSVDPPSTMHPDNNVNTSGRMQTHDHQRSQWQAPRGNNNEPNPPYTTNVLQPQPCSPIKKKPAYYLRGFVGPFESRMLLDTGSALTIIDERVWLDAQSGTSQLLDAPFSITSASRHTLDVRGQADVTLTLYTKKNSTRSFQVRATVVRQLSKPVIIGMDFLTTYDANIHLGAMKVLFKVTGHVLHTR
jgi:hypothetical protein